jgi:hypothetical protein
MDAIVSLARMSGGVMGVVYNHVPLSRLRQATLWRLELRVFYTQKAWHETFMKMLLRSK